MSKKRKLEKLVKEFIVLLERGNITLEEVSGNCDLLLSHPDFDKAIDILAAMDDLLNGRD
jgi:hypothetical protein